MFLLKLCLLFGVIYIARTQTYDDLVRDYCFKKVYICENHREVNVIGEDGRYFTEEDHFKEMCRENKEFINCLIQTAEFCAESGNISDIAQITLDHRISLAMFCREPAWIKDYFIHVGCINKHEERSMADCRVAENEREEDRPLRCLVPEPCESIKKIAECSFEDMKNKCGPVAAEVYKRLHYLKFGKLDVVCEYRLRNRQFCHYERTDNYQKQRQPRIERRTGVTSPLELAIDNLSDMVSETLQSVSKYVRQIYKNQLKSEGLKYLRSELDELVRDQDHHYQNTQRRSSKFSNFMNLDSELKSDIDWHDFKQAETICEADKTKLNLQNCGQRLRKPVSKTFQEKSADVETIKDSLFILYDLLKNESVDIFEVDRETLELQWRKLDKLPIEQISCKWIITSTGRVFRCSIKQKDISVDSNSSRSSSHYIIIENIKDMLAKLSSQDFQSTHRKNENSNFSLKDNKKSSVPVEVLKIEIENFDILNTDRIGDQIFESTNGYKEFLEDQSKSDETFQGVDTENQGNELNYILIDSDLEEIYKSLDGRVTTTETSLAFEIPSEYNPETNTPLKDLNDAEVNIVTESSFESIRLKQLEDSLDEKFRIVDVVFEPFENNFKKTYRSQKGRKNSSIKDCYEEKVSHKEEVFEDVKMEFLNLNGAANIKPENVKNSIFNEESEEKLTLISNIKESENSNLGKNFESDGSKLVHSSEYSKVEL